MLKAPNKAKTLRMEHVNGRKFTEKKKEKKKKNKVEEIQLANLASLEGLASDQSVTWYACEATLGKERYVMLNGWKTRRSVC